MKAVFADTGFWIALLNKRDRWHQQAIKIYQQLNNQKKKIITSEMVLTEFLNFFSKFAPEIRKEAGLTVKRMQNHPNIIIIVQNNKQFSQALDLYLKRLDKGWSLTDCTSFQIMEDLRLTEALAHDKHFQQAGFIPILKEENL